MACGSSSSYMYSSNECISSDRFRAQVLKHYMSRFDFTCQRLDAAFRTLCGKLYFKAEAQQMDRILGAFAYRYWECHTNMVHDVGPQKTFGSPGMYHLIATWMATHSLFYRWCLCSCLRYFVTQYGFTCCSSRQRG